MEVNKNMTGPGLLLPGNLCLLCRLPRDSRSGICPGCRHDLPWIRDACRRCGLPMAWPGICTRCLNGYLPIDGTVCAFTYHYPVSEVIKNIKYKQMLTYLSGFSDLLVERLQQACPPLPDVLVPVPLHHRRLLERGFNQSLIIGRRLSGALGVPCDHTLARRDVYTRPMAGLKPRQRRRNIHGVFSLRRIPAYRGVAIVDDVVTTGATTRELAELLRKNGVPHIQVWALARA